jgi:phage terminase large subunit
MFQQVTATRKLLNLQKRVRGIAGGTSASKTVSILLLLIQYAQTHENKVISVVSESMPHLRKGAMRDFVNIMQTHNYLKDNRWNKTESTYTFETGSIIEFFGVESWEKVKGARRDVLFINEANHVDYNSYTQLEVRTKEVIWLDWNPENEFWWYSEVLPKSDVDFITLTYKDNEACPPQIVQAIEARRYNLNWWKVYGLGQLGEVEGRIYTKWQIIKDIPIEARLTRYGMDFGYSNDPTAIVAVYYYNGGYIFDEKLYQMGMKNREIAEYLKTLPSAIAIADSAEPKSIDEIKEYGFPQIYPASKGVGSVLQGIQYVQSQSISVTSSSVNLLKEYRNYLWQTDKEGKIINQPQEFMNHCMDAIRYGLDKFNKKGVFTQNLEVGGVKPYIEGTII